MGDMGDFLVRIADPRSEARLVLDGPRPTSLADIGQVAPVCEVHNYVYMFLTSGWATYIGMSRTPALRFATHRRRDWFPATNGYVLVQLTANAEWIVRRATRNTERDAIHMFGPTANIAGVLHGT